MVAGLVAGYPERATDRRFESYPFRSFHRCAHASKGVGILDSLAELSKAKVSGMQALPSTSPPQWLWFMAEGETGYRNARIEGVGPV